MACESWPAEELEAVCQCPYCGGTERTLAYEGVEDWAFGCAPGLWNYWNCSDCLALILHPRPTAASIGKAYARYYTHGDDQRRGFMSRIKQRLRNELWSQVFNTSIHPRLGLPRGLGWNVKGLWPWIAEPFGLRQWVQLPKGLLIDVGCGNGDKLKMAGQLGWRALGIELDAAAVQAGLAQGLQVLQGGYELLANYQGQADCLVCSHVLEHVHQPLHLLELLCAALKPDGVLLLSSPNASSQLRNHYGANWRGIEAPRHLAVPNASWLIAWLRRQGFECTQVPSPSLETAVESERMQRRGQTTERVDKQAARTLLKGFQQTSMAEQDVVQLICQRAKQ